MKGSNGFQKNPQKPPTWIPNASVQKVSKLTPYCLFTIKMRLTFKNPSVFYIFLSPVCKNLMFSHSFLTPMLKNRYRTQDDPRGPQETPLDLLWITFGSVLDHFWITLGSLLDQFWTIFGTFLRYTCRYRYRYRYI